MVRAIVAVKRAVKAIITFTMDISTTEGSGFGVRESAEEA